MRELYLKPSKGQWTISRFVSGRWIYLVQDSYLDRAEDAAAILEAIHISATEANLDEYFPPRGAAGRCPTLELMELCCVLDPTNPIHTEEQRNETGV